MTFLIIGSVLAGLVVIAFPLLCFYLIKQSDRKQNLMTWKTFLLIFAIIAMGIASIVLIFLGAS